MCERVCARESGARAKKNARKHALFFNNARKHASVKKIARKHALRFHSFPLIASCFHFFPGSFAGSFDGRYPWISCTQYACYQIFSSLREEQVLFMMCTHAQQYRPTCHDQTHTCASQMPKSQTTRTPHSHAPASDDVQMD